VNDPNADFLLKEIADDDIKKILKTDILEE